MNIFAIKRLRIYVLAAMAFTTIAAQGQCKFCRSYDDFIDNNWERIDTVYCKKRDKKQQFWWEGGYTLTTGNKDLDKTLKYDAFIVMQSDTAYLNCRNVRHDTVLFEKGYTRVKRFNNNGLLFANQFVDKKSQQDIRTASFVGGIIGGLSAASAYKDKQVCYIISSGADGIGYINTRMIDDQMIEEMMEKDIIKDGKLYLEYTSEGKKAKRMNPSHVIPILEKAGLIK